MKYTTLPHTDIKVSKICLGSMTWGNQNTEVEGHEQLNYAFDNGVNFIDSAELYPVPANAETQGKTSEIIGSWLKQTGHRDKVILASKIAGPGDYTAHIRTTGFSPKSIANAVDLELKRLQTDYIDLYQLHWPERNTNRLDNVCINKMPNGMIISMRFCIVWIKKLKQVVFATLVFLMKILGARCVIYKNIKRMIYHVC